MNSLDAYYERLEDNRLDQINTQSSCITLKSDVLRNRICTKIWHDMAEYNRRHHKPAEFVKVPQDFIYVFSPAVYTFRGFPYDMILGLCVCFTDSIKTVEEIEVF